jgi:ADP-dependent NAD(P)H-hydrate dehydratase / NAD(P)H-hydrate epimerase
MSTNPSLLSVATAQQVYEADRCMTDHYHIPSPVLMENAALAAYRVMRENIPDLAGSSVLVVCGPGNNGEDGLVLARILAVDHVAVSILYLPESTAESALRKIKTLRRLNIRLYYWNDSLDVMTFVQDYNILVDAIFGIGLTRPAEGRYLAAIKAINAAQRTVVSLDIPSGITADTGEKLGEAVSCEFCVSFGLLKAGNLIHNGYAHIRWLFLANLNAPYQLFTEQAFTEQVLVNTPICLPERDKTAHKTTYGQCLLIAGSSHYYGAPFFSSASFLRAGGGYARLITPHSVAVSIASLVPSCVFLPVDDHDNLAQYLDYINQHAPTQDFLVFGPGISLAQQNNQILSHLLTDPKLREIPLLIDGDGLNLLADNLDLLSSRTPYTTILTPHPGEMSRLTRLSVDEIQSDLIGIARRYAKRWKVILVLKGPRTIIVSKDNVFINTTGTNALATPGTGDVLDGMIAALACRQLTLPEAVRAAVFMHGLLGNLLSNQNEEGGFTADDILSVIPEAASIYKQKCQEYDSRSCADSIPGIFMVR